MMKPLFSSLKKPMAATRSSNGVSQYPYDLDFNG